VARRLLAATCALSTAFIAVRAALHLDGAAISQWPLFVMFGIASGFCVARAVLVPGERAAWACIAAGLGVYAFGGVIYIGSVAGSADPPFPSLADWSWVAMYPWLLAGLVLIVRARGLGSQASVWLDGLVGALAFATFGLPSSSSPCGRRRSRRTWRSRSCCRCSTSCWPAS
jgi:hypothetical protein